MNRSSPTTATSEGNALASKRQRLNTFRALRHRNYRLLWISLVVSSVGTWMQIVAQSLLVLKLTHNSALALGIVSLAQAGAFLLFALIGGGVADRLDRRRLLLCTQSSSMGLALLLGLLTHFGVIQVWMIVLIAFCNSVVLSFDQPARSSLIPQLVPREDLMNAISLQSAVFNGAAVIGPSLAGLTIGFIHYAGNFFLNALSYLGVLIVLFLMRVPAGEGQAAASGAPASDLMDSIRESLQVIGRDAVLPWVIAAYGVLLFFNPSAAIILPYFSVQVLHLTPLQLGLLFSASGVGTVAGALGLASLGEVKRKGRALILAFSLWTVALLVFALSHLFWLSLLTLFLVGAMQNMIAATTITLMQTRVPSQMRGRVMSLNTLLIMAIRPLGDFCASGLIALIGGPPTVALAGAIVGLLSLLLVGGRPAVRHLAEPGARPPQS
ncbi:MAG: MFS transporter [Thermogemmatispora sp.]|uniref:MFS transporter n=1 Tax=Thermogemmatispora sp. TaxID=1968838 RepID=UPI0019D82876|nr:MFS transporter [Thermogemmatispora sp.]MBE3566004.1 MFS transporter [Thermogemmatispora sp.]